MGRQSCDQRPLLPEATGVRDVGQEVASAHLLIQQLELDQEARECHLRELEGAMKATTVLGCATDGAAQNDRSGGTSWADAEDGPPTGLPTVMALGLVRAASGPKTGGVWRPTLRHKTADVLMVSEIKGDGRDSDGKPEASEQCTASCGGSSPLVDRSVPSTPDYSDATPTFLQQQAGATPTSDPGCTHGSARMLVQPPAPPQAPPVFVLPFEHPMLAPPPAPPTDAPTFPGSELDDATGVADPAKAPAVYDQKSCVALLQSMLSPARSPLLLQDTVAPPVQKPLAAWPVAAASDCFFNAQSQGLSQSAMWQPEHPSTSLLSTSCPAPISWPQPQHQPQQPVLGPPWPLPPATPVAHPAPVPVHEPWSQPCLWYCVTFLGGIDVRADPSADGRRTGVVMPQGTAFAVAESLVGFDGRIYLRLADGSGWAFDDSALVPGDPSVLQVAGVCMADGSGFVSTVPPEASMEPTWSFCGQTDNVQQLPQAFCGQGEGGLQLPKAGELPLPQQPSELQYHYTAYLSTVDAAPVAPFHMPEGDATMPQLVSAAPL